VPSPGWTAFAPARFAAAISRSPRRYGDEPAPPARCTP
jgi:hypothetical protein